MVARFSILAMTNMSCIRLAITTQIGESLWSDAGQPHGVDVVLIPGKNHVVGEYGTSMVTNWSTSSSTRSESVESASSRSRR